MARSVPWVLLVVLGLLVTTVPASAAHPSTAPVAVPAPAAPTAASVPSEVLPGRAALLADARLAVDHFYATGGGATADAGWRWAPYFLAVDELLRATGDPRYQAWLQSWGDRNRWDPDAPPSPTSNPDSRAALQVWVRSEEVGVRADLSRGDALMRADLALPASQYWWIDALFMGLPLWSTYAQRTGDPAYRAKGAQFYDFLKTRGRTSWRTGCTDTGLFDPAEDLWWRDCQYVPRRDALGHEVFWSRGNGWLLAALARTLEVMPADDPQRAEYTAMLRRMTARLVALQPADGVWRTSLLSPSLHPLPETSGTALIAYAMASGLRSGVLDAPTYLPALARAWNGVRTTALQPSGFLSHCQGVAEAPGTPSTTTSIGYCVGAFALAATAITELDGLVAADAFSRTTAAGWGLAGTGGFWRRPGGTAADGVRAGAGRLSATAGQTRTTVLPGVAVSDSDVRVEAALTPPVRGSAYLGLVARQSSAGYYSGRVVVPATGAARVQLQRSGVTLASLGVLGLTVRAGDRLALRLLVTGSATTTVRAKVWRAGTPEPATWSASATDTAAGLPRSGAVGATLYLTPDGSPAPVTVAFDDFRARTTAVRTTTR